MASSYNGIWMGMIQQIGENMYDGNMRVLTYFGIFW